MRGWQVRVGLHWAVQGLSSSAFQAPEQWWLPRQGLPLQQPPHCCRQPMVGVRVGQCLGLDSGCLHWWAQGTKPAKLSINQCA